MSTDQICAYCEHSARLHLNGVGVCHHGDGNTIQHLCGCPRFVANTDTETHEVPAQVLAEATARERPLGESLGVLIDAVGGPHHIPTDLVPPSHYVGPAQSRATKISIIVFHCADQRIQAARAGRHEDAEEWRELIKRIDEL